MRPKLLSVVALTLAAVAATAARAETEPLAGSEWRPVEIEGVEVAEDVETFIRFGEDGKVEGNGGCNRFFGSVEIDGETLAFGPLAATKMLCPGPASETEDRFFAALAEATAFHRDGTVLELTAADGEPLIVLAQTDAD